MFSPGYGAFGIPSVAITTVTGGPVSVDDSGKGDQALSELSTLGTQIGSLNTTETIQSQLEAKANRQLFEAHEAKIGALDTIAAPHTVMSILAAVKAEASTIGTLQTKISSKIEP
jgi:hypothetical protein